MCNFSISPLDQLADILGYKGDKISLLTICFLHSLYTMMVVLALKLIDMPMVLKACITLLLAINTLSKLRNDKSIRLINLTYLLVIIICGKFTKLGYLISFFAHLIMIFILTITLNFMWFNGYLIKSLVHRLVIKFLQIYCNNQIANPGNAVLVTPQKQYNDSLNDTDYDIKSTRSSERVYKKLSWTQTPDQYPADDSYVTFLQALKKEVADDIKEPRPNDSQDKVVNGLTPPPSTPSPQPSEAGDSSKWTFKNPRCLAITTSGRQCRLPSCNGINRCYRHKQTAKK